MTAYPDRAAHQHRRDRRSLTSGLVASIGGQDLPVLNYAVGGILVGDCWLPAMVGQRLFVTLFEERNPKDRVFVYGVVVRLDRLSHEMALDFEKPSSETFVFLETMQSRSVGGLRRSRKMPKKSLGWFQRLTGISKSKPRRRR